MSARANPNWPMNTNRVRKATRSQRWLHGCCLAGFALGCVLFATPAKGQAPSLPKPVAAPSAKSNGPIMSFTSEQVPEPPPPVLPPPKPLTPPPIGVKRPKPLPPGDRVLGTTPTANRETMEKYQRYFGQLIDPELTLDLVTGQTRLVMLKETPKRIQVANEGIVDYNFVGKDQILIMGQGVGHTNVTFWFTDLKDPTKEELLVFYVRVSPDPEYRARLEKIYKNLEGQINCAFPDSVICLHVVGDKVIVTGHAKDIAECTQILKIIRANGQGNQGGSGGHSRAAALPSNRIESGRDPNSPTEQNNQLIAPATDNYLIDGSNWLVNMIRIAGEQTVNLRVTVAEIDRSAARSIGLNFTLLNNSGTPYFASSVGGIANGGLASSSGVGFGGGASAALSGGFIPGIPGVNLGAGGYNNLPASLDNGQVRLAISALRNVNYAKLMAETNLTTINGETAQFHSGGEYPLPLLAGGYGGFGLQGVQFRPYGANLSFTPYITDRDRIRLVLDANITAINQSNGTTNIGGAQIPNFNQRHVNTTVELREGQTLAVAGLIQNNWVGDGHRVPFFGDLPYFGRLFSFDRVSAGEQELIILVTPELVHPIDCKKRLALPGSDLFEPTDHEFYLLGRIESHRQVDFRSPIRTDWQRIKNYQDMEAAYIHGPSGYAEP